MSYTNDPAQNQTIELLQEMLLTLYDVNCFAVHDEIVAFHKEVVTYYHDSDFCLLYHVLMGSTPPHQCTYWDLPENHSIQQFIIAQYRQNLHIIEEKTESALTIPQVMEHFDRTKAYDAISA